MRKTLVIMGTLILGTLLKGTRRKGTRLKGALLMGALLMVIAAADALAGVTVSLLPGTSTIEPNETVRIGVHVDSAGSEFNGYEAVIRWNPDVLAFVSVQAESLFAPYQQWWRPTVGPDSVLISHVIMQGGTTVTGPGTLSSLTLRAIHTGVSPVAFDRIEFYRFGYLVLPVTWNDAIVRVEDETSRIGWVETPPTPRMSLRVAPNPIRTSSWIEFRIPSATPGALRLYEISGRLVGSVHIPVDRSSGDWGRLRVADAFGGMSSASGVYFLRLETPCGVQVRRLNVSR